MMSNLYSAMHHHPYGVNVGGQSLPIEYVDFTIECEYRELQPEQ